MNDNAAVFNYLKYCTNADGSKTFPAFLEFTFSNNYLTYKNNILFLGNFSLNDFKNHNVEILNTLNALHTFKCLMVQVKAINQVILPTPATHETTHLVPIVLTEAMVNDKDDNIDNIISLDEFLIFLNQKETYTGTHLKKLETIFGFLKQLIIYHDYLIEKVQNIFTFIKNSINKLEYNSVNSANKRIVMERYIATQQEADMEIPDGDALVEEPVQLLLKQGYVSSAVLITICINLGIAIAVLLLALK